MVLKNVLLKGDMLASLEGRVGKEKLDKLLNASVAVCGLGGLGSNIAIALARAGVGKLHLIDFDRVDISNMNRQQYFTDQLGMEKTEALSDTINRIAPYTEITTDFVRLDEKNVPVLLKDEDIICEAFDRPEAKAMLVETALKAFPDKYIVSGSGMSGFGSNNLIKTERRLSKLYVCGDMESDVFDESKPENSSLVSSRVLAAAAHEAHMIIRLIIGEEEP
ncbi:MAG: sulfur carrier protein ThiS adenylyltransferase ThiF [Lachnospiraceae bacterium]|nr:sulfur carrier protein ThiS adenylyltransferase ThiF [Lachnospiraceae bacterium]